MNTEKLQLLNKEALEKEDQKATCILNLVIRVFIFSLVAVAGYSGYRQGQGTNLPWSVWIPPLFFGAIGIFLAARRFFKVKKK